MSGTRFARSGRCRLFLCLVALMLMFGMVAIFHSSQQQLDETREQRMRCEQQQEALNIRLQSIVEQKYNLEKSQERERDEQMKTRKGLEQKLTSQNEIHANDQMEATERYGKLQESFNTLQNEHKKLVDDYSHATKQHTEAINALEKKLQLLRTELEKEKNAQDTDVQWKEKYNALAHEKQRLDAIITSNDPKVTKQRISHLEHIVAEYKSNCDYKPKDYLLDGQQINKPLNPPDTTRNISPPRLGFDKPENVKSFSEQKVIAPKPLKKVSEETPETQLKQDQEKVQQQQDDHGNANIASPLSAPLRSTETKKGQIKNLISSTSISPPLSLPLSQRRLPVNVAPIPENFDELLKEDHANEKATAEKFNNNVDPADIDAAVEELPKNDNDNDNNRYANVVNELEQKAKVGAAANEDSGAHEIKDHDFINDQNFNLPADEDNNFFGGGDKHEAAVGGGGLAGDVKKHKAVGANNDDDDDLLGNAGPVGIGGDIAVKNQNLLDADNLNNEVLRDQGKEFQDGLHLEDGNDEDEDEDDYSNPAARKQGAQAIRN